MEDQQIKTVSLKINDYEFNYSINYFSLKIS